MKKVIIVGIVFLMFAQGAFAQEGTENTIIGKWIFEPEGSLYRMRFLFLRMPGTAEAFFPVDDRFKKNPEALRNVESIDSSTIAEIVFIDDGFISLHYKNGYVLRGLYSLSLFYDAVETGYTYDELKIWKLTVVDSEKAEHTFFLRHKPVSNDIQMTYQKYPYVVFGTLTNAEGRTISLDAYRSDN